MRKLQKVNVKLGQVEVEVNYHITNWCAANQKELAEVFGSFEDFVEDSQQLKAFHGPHGYIRRLCKDKVCEAARLQSPAVFTEVSDTDELGNTVIRKVETQESAARFARLCEELAPSVLGSLTNLEAQFGMGAKAPTKADMADAANALEIFQKNAEAYTQLRSKAKELGIKLPATPEVQSLAEYLRAKTLAEKGNALARF